jgi:hypothetical protein
MLLFLVCTGSAGPISGSLSTPTGSARIVFVSIAGSAHLVSWLVLLTVAVVFRAFEGFITRSAVRVVCALYTVAPWADACLSVAAFANLVPNFH